MDVDSAHTGTAVSVDLSVLLSFQFWETYRPNFTQRCLKLKESGNLIEIQYFDSEKRGNSVILQEFTEYQKKCFQSVQVQYKPKTLGHFKKCITYHQYPKVQT